MPDCLPELAVERLGPEIGGRVLNSKRELLGGELAEPLRALLEERGVLLFPQIEFDPEEQVAFTRTLGRYVADTPDGSALRLRLEGEGASAEYLKGSFYWHFDGYMNPVPIRASLLVAEAVSPSGGETEFSNTYAAYDALPETRKRQIADLRVVHALAAAQLAVEPEPSHDTFKQWLRVPSRTLPLVWRHASGRKSLVIGNSAAGIAGMDPLESRELLIFLRDWATQPRFTYSHTWTVGDAVLWDNTGTLHRALPYPADSGRTMRRTKLAGEEPLG